MHLFLYLATAFAGSVTASTATSCTETRTSTVTTTTTASATATSTCSVSRGICPTAGQHDPCCAYQCAEAQVPFSLCSPEDISGEFSVCQRCPNVTTTATAPPSPPPSTTPTSSSFATSTCSRRSTDACPTAFSPCCAYICAEAQVPFALCSPEDDTGEFASCSRCPGSTPTPTATTAITTPTTTTGSSTTSFITSTCSRRRIVTCPTAFNPCCAYVCSEAQVPFNVCSPEDESGEFASCTRCAGPTAKL